MCAYSVVRLVGPSVEPGRANNDSSNGSRDSRMHIRLHHSIMVAQITVDCDSMMIIWWLMLHASPPRQRSRRRQNSIFDLNSTEIRRKSEKRKFQMKLNTIFAGAEHVLSLSFVDWLFHSSNNKTMDFKQSLFSSRVCAPAVWVISFSIYLTVSLSFYFIFFFLILCKQIGICECILIIQILNKYFIYQSVCR